MICNFDINLLQDITEKDLVIDCFDGKNLDCKILLVEKFYHIHIGMYLK